MATENVGVVRQVLGPVVDVEFTLGMYVVRNRHRGPCKGESEDQCPRTSQYEPQNRSLAHFSYPSSVDVCFVSLEDHSPSATLMLFWRVDRM